MPRTPVRLSQASFRAQTMDEFQRDLETLRCAPAALVPIGDLTAQRCIACGSKEFAIGKYPAFKSSFFAGKILAFCGRCGLGWVPIADLDLDTYYKKHYADEFKRTRKIKGKFYSADNPIWRQEKNAVRDRGFAHAALMKQYGRFHRVLDIGAGEGFFLSRIDADQRYADEIDPYAVAILKNELGVEIATVDDKEITFDLVVASHVLEHFTYENIKSKLESIWQSLVPGGMFLIEVPGGAFQILQFSLGKRGFNTRLEPHTLFFSSVSLVMLLKAAKFTIIKAACCPWTRNHFDLGREDSPLQGVEAMPNGPLIVLARRPG